MLINATHATIKVIDKLEDNTIGGTHEGGLAAAAANKAKNPNHYQEIGAKGGRNGNTGGFQKGSQAAREAGRKGGLKQSTDPETYHRRSKALKAAWVRRKAEQQAYLNRVKQHAEEN